MSQTKIAVPQAAGEIVVRRGGAEPVTYPVSNGTVTVDQADAESFIAQVDGAKQVSGTPAAAPPKETPA